MRINKIALALVSALAITSTFATAANATTVRAKTITCYKGTQVKKVTTAKCPAGWSTKKPAATASKTAKFDGTFKGTGTLVWSASDVKVTSMSGTGGSATLGLTKISGTGSSSPQSSTALIAGKGSFSGSGGTLNFTLDNKSFANAAAESAPTTVAISANAVITGGTGKYAGATGTLKITGDFSITTTAAGKSETQSFTAVVSGTINLK